MHKVSVEVVVAVAKFSKVSIMLCRTFDSIVVEYSSTQYVEKIIHQIAKTFNKAYTGLRSKLSIFRICFAQNSICKGMDFTS